jgi:hypothetical protein
MEEIKEEIEQKKAELVELEKKQELFNSLPENLRLAEILHKIQCHSNHADGCGWYYEKWGQIPLGYAHAEYIKRANKFIWVSKKYGVDAATLLKIFSEIEIL